MLSDCAAAVVTALEGHTFTPAIAPVRTWNDLATELDDDELHVDVVGVNHEGFELIERGGGNNDGTAGYTTQVAVGVRKKFGVDEQSSLGNVEVAEVDELVSLTEAINEYLTERTIGTNSDFEWESSSFLTSVVHKWLRVANQYTGIVLITYTHAKSLA